MVMKYSNHSTNKHGMIRKTHVLQPHSNFTITVGLSKQVLLDLSSYYMVLAGAIDL